MLVDEPELSSDVVAMDLFTEGPSTVVVDHGSAGWPAVLKPAAGSARAERRLASERVAGLLRGLGQAFPEPAELELEGKAEEIDDDDVSTATAGSTSSQSVD